MYLLYNRPHYVCISFVILFVIFLHLIDFFFAFPWNFLSEFGSKFEQKFLYICSQSPTIAFGLTEPVLSCPFDQVTTPRYVLYILPQYLNEFRVYAVFCDDEYWHIYHDHRTVYYIELSWWCVIGNKFQYKRNDNYTIILSMVNQTINEYQMKCLNQNIYERLMQASCTRNKLIK